MEVPGPNNLPTPWVCSLSMSSFGMIPPPVTQDIAATLVLSSSWTRGNSVMCAPREDREADDVDILLHRRAGDHLGCLVEPGIDDLHPGVTERGRDDLRAPVVSVEAGLGDQHADGALFCHWYGTGMDRII